ncbi:MAG: hypothetical protein K8R40_05645 [Anaerolineaceae bacterium]|nr:hypothetical protein [Anaerolineaceae bacterium]
MPKEKMIVIFIAGSSLAEVHQSTLIENVRAQLQLPAASVRLLQPGEWQGGGQFNDAQLNDKQARSELLGRQKAYMNSHRWPFSNDAIADAFREMGGNTTLDTLYFAYAFDQQKLLDAEGKADTLYVEWVPAKKYRRPAIWILLLAFLIFLLPVTLSFLFPDWLGAGWAILDLVALWGAGTLAWRGSIRRLRKYPVLTIETCGGCGHHNRVTSVVTFNCGKCGKDLAYELVKDQEERALRIQQVKCPYCSTSNDLRFRRVRYACQRCKVKQVSKTHL